ncbi:hypothetical protein SAZ11_45220 [Streptomyces sp. FXJ1.4098]|nr:hypothetical protein [Streptomyces sp. FXJ1.4098]
MAVEGLVEELADRVLHVKGAALLGDQVEALPHGGGGHLGERVDVDAQVERGRLLHDVDVVCQRAEAELFERGLGRDGSRIGVAEHRRGVAEHQLQHRAAPVVG